MMGVEVVAVTVARFKEGSGLGLAAGLGVAAAYWNDDRAAPRVWWSDVSLFGVAPMSAR